ncbi:MAG: trypsin-like peptidase domain-containing protein [Streptosporangiaceae bacterium]|jgi:S1-C subfamily serine protease
MHDSGTSDSEERPPVHNPAGSPVAVDADLAQSSDSSESSAGTEGTRSGEAFPRAAPRRTGLGGGARLAACVAAGVMALGAGFGLTRLIDAPGAAPLASAIPSPATSGGVFVEDDDGTAQDNQTNILQSTAPGLVHIVSGGKAVGIGLVLTPSGKVLTTYQPSGAASLTARYVLSGRTFKATTLGTDAAVGLALLQLQGGGGRAFPVLAVGNSDALADDTYASKQLSYHIRGEVFDTAVGTSGTQDAVALDTGLLVALNRSASVGGNSQSGLMQSLLQSAPAMEIGGPLVNLNGQVIGITVAGAGTGLKISGYAIPINQALAIARQIDARARPAS